MTGIVIGFTSNLLDEETDLGVALAAIEQSVFMSLSQCDMRFARYRNSFIEEASDAHRLGRISTATTLAALDYYDLMPNPLDRLRMVADKGKKWAGPNGDNLDEIIYYGLEPDEEPDY